MARILIVEDDPMAAKIIGRGLIAGGHSCAYVNSSDKAMEFVHAEQTDLVLLDVMMPGVSGFEFCRRVRRDPDLFTLPIIIISAMNNEEEISHGLAQGADDYMGKPANIPVLLQRIEAILQTSNSSQANDSLTALPSASVMRRELQRRISNNESFALLYLEILNVREFSRDVGIEARQQAIQQLAEILKKAGSALSLKEFMVGHMGGGHFSCLMLPEEANQFATWILSEWRTGLDTFYKSLGQTLQYNKDNEPIHSAPVIDILICGVGDRKEITTPQHVFEVLSQIRNKVMENKRGCFYFDKRA